MSLQKLELADYLLTGNRSKFLYVESSTAWLCDCHQFFSPLCDADGNFDRIPCYFKNTLLCIDPITRQISNFATPISCDDNPERVIESDIDNDEHYNRTHKPVLRSTSTLFEPEKVRSARSCNTLPAKEAGYFYKHDLTSIWNCVLFTKHADTTLTFSRKTLSFGVFDRLRNTSRCFFKNTDRP